MCDLSAQPTKDKPSVVQSKRLTAVFDRSQVRGACKSRRVAARYKMSMTPPCATSTMLPPSDTNVPATSLSAVFVNRLFDTIVLPMLTVPRLREMPGFHAKAFTRRFPVSEALTLTPFSK